MAMDMWQFGTCFLPVFCILGVSPDTGVITDRVLTGTVRLWVLIQKLTAEGSLCPKMAALPTTSSSNAAARDISDVQNRREQLRTAANLGSVN